MTLTLTPGQQLLAAQFAKNRAAKEGTTGPQCSCGKPARNQILGDWYCDICDVKWHRREGLMPPGFE